MELVRYDAACRAVAEARTIDEVKEISNRAEAARAYARQAKNKQMEIDATEIRVRAERRLGQIILDLKKSGSVAGQGVRDHTAKGERTVLRLSELGIDSAISSVAQRLAMLPESTFGTEMSGWRRRVENSSRMEVPLQTYRKPSTKADRQKASLRLGRKHIDVENPLDHYRSIDGRRIADWRAGELDRLADLGRRVSLCAETLKSEMPIANPDPLATVEMIFERAALDRILHSIWLGPITPGNAGLHQVRAETTINKLRRNCENCGAEFVMRHPSGKALQGKSREGRFCSRACMGEFRKSQNVGGTEPNN